MKWKKIVKESVDERTFKKLLKQNGITKLPSGMSSRRDGLLEWRKERGYAGEKTIDRMRQQAEAAGWKRGREMDDAHPDGSWVASGDVYVSPDGQIEMSYYSYYGATSYDNSFSITFKMVGGAVNESDEDDDFANSDRPQIYRYYDDDETPLEDFVKHVHSVEQDIEDTFIQNSDVYENADDPWELFCDDMHGENLTLEESLDLDYYMNNAAYEQLPEDIKKYVYRSSGSCDFDSIQWLRGIFERLMPICKDPVDESTITGTGRVDFDDDLVAVYTPDGKLEYKGIFDDCPYKDEPMQYDRKNMAYRFEAENGDYRTMVKLSESCKESSRFGFNVGDEVELTSDVEPNRFSDRGVVSAGTVGEIVAVDKPMRGIIKVKIEDGNVVSVPERKLKIAGTDNEPWEKFKKPPEPPRKPDPETLARQRPEWIYMEPARPGSPKWTGD